MTLFYVATGLTLIKFFGVDLVIQLGGIGYLYCLYY